jgi:hypothetical protein
MLIWSARASAAYERIATFGGALSAGEGFTAKDQIGGANGIAINTTGSGGVEAGTIYVATVGTVVDPNPGLRIARFSPEGDFELAWQGSERCGPALGTECPIRAEGAGSAVVGVSVDQATGLVYVFNGEVPPGQDTIKVYNADGSHLVTEFAQKAPEGISTESTPNMYHGSSGLPGGIAVTDTGKVYLFDVNLPDQSRYRLMQFDPEPAGNYEQYVYGGISTGAPSGLILPGEEGTYPSRPTLNSAGDIYVAEEARIDEYDPNAPTASPLCSFVVKNSGARGMTVNPVNGDVFYYDYKDKMVHVLEGTCGSDGSFVEKESFVLSPPRAIPQALAFDPALELVPGEPMRVLYVTAPSGGGEGGIGEKGAGGIGYMYADHVVAPPVATVGSASRITDESAVLRGQITPNGLRTTYSFQYLSEAAYLSNDPSEPFAGAAEAPLGGGTLSVLQGNNDVSALVTGLDPATAYKYRIVAQNGEGVAVSGAASFKTFPALSGLPDSRGFELVSPPEKGGGQVYPAYPRNDGCVGKCKPGIAQESFPAQTTAEGSEVVYEGDSFTAGGAPSSNEYFAVRTSEGWKTTAISSPEQTNGLNGGFGFRGVDPSLSVGVTYQRLPTLSPAAPPGYPNLYRVPTATPNSPEPLLTVGPPNRPPGASFTLSYAGASSDYSRIFFAANDALTGETSFAPPAEDGGLSKFNLYEWHEGTLTLVNVLPGNASAPVGASFGRPATNNAISANGLRVFWSTESGQVFVREDGMSTRPISTAGVPDPGLFLTAAVDGSRVLLSNGHLHEVGGSEATIDLTEGMGGFKGVVGQSANLEAIYFVDTSALTGEEQNEFGAVAKSGGFNLYSWKAGETTFIATLSEDEEGKEDWESPTLARRTAQASENGRWLAFQNDAAITPYDNSGPCKPVQGGLTQGPCREVFLYDAATRQLRCVSCNPTGEAPIGSSRVPSRESPLAPALPQMHYLTNAGRLYFDSQDHLSLADSNGRNEDVYQFEPAGAGSCTAPEGCLSLISSGSSATDSNFLTADENGENVFFTTRAQLVPADKDALVDLYDARVGANPAPEATPPKGCAGEACQQATSPPTLASPGSTGLRPEASTKVGKCRKGQTKKHGHCVKKKRKTKRRHAHRHHKGSRRHSKVQQQKGGR